MATYYLDPQNGTDTTAGGGGTAYNNAWATTQYAIDQMDEGDELRMMNTQTETTSSVIDFDFPSATITANAGGPPIVFVAADSNGDPLDGSGQYTLSNTGAGDLANINVGELNIKFIDVRFTGNVSSDDNLTCGFGDYYVTFIRCRIDNAGDDGVYWITTNGIVKFIDCEIDNNGGQGLATNGGGRLNAFLIRCKVHDNNGVGAQISGDQGAAAVINSEIYDNGGDGLVFDGDQCHGTIHGNTFFANDGDNIQVAATSGLVTITENSINDAGAYGINTNSSDNLTLSHNHYNGNVTNELSTGASTEQGKQTGDPVFANETDNAEDFTPGSNSPLIENGIHGNNIGSKVHAEGGGGGGGISQLAGIGGGLITAVR